MFNLKLIALGLIAAVLILGGVIDIRVNLHELPNIPGRLITMVRDQDFIVQGKEYASSLIASFRHSDGDNEEEKEGEVAGAKDDKKTEEGDKENDDQEEKRFRSLFIPLRF